MLLSKQVLDERATLAVASGKLTQVQHDLWSRMTAPNAKFSWMDFINFIPLIGTVIPELAPLIALAPMVMKIINAIMELIKSNTFVIPIPPDGGTIPPTPLS